MNKPLGIAVIALLFLTATAAHAACTRDDIEFYLSKGFDQEQITAICTAAPEASAPSPATPEPADDIAVVPSEDDDVTDAERFLQETIEGHDIFIEQGFLHYTARICIPYGRFNNNKEPWVEEACELVRHRVALRGMTAKREWISQKLFQPRQIYLEGRIEREFVGDLDDFAANVRMEIRRNLQNEAKAIVPIKENMSPDRLLDFLNELAT